MDIWRSRKFNYLLQRRQPALLEEGEKSPREEVHPALERCLRDTKGFKQHAAWYNHKRFGFGNDCVHSRGYCSTARKGNHMKEWLCLYVSSFSAKEFFAAVVPQYSGAG